MITPDQEGADIFFPHPDELMEKKFIPRELDVYHQAGLAIRMLDVLLQQAGISTGGTANSVIEVFRRAQISERGEETVKSWRIDLADPNSLSYLQGVRNLLSCYLERKQPDEAVSYLDELAS